MMMQFKIFSLISCIGWGYLIGELDLFVWHALAVCLIGAFILTALGQIADGI